MKSILIQHWMDFQIAMLLETPHFPLDSEVSLTFYSVATFFDFIFSRFWNSSMLLLWWTVSNEKSKDYKGIAFSNRSWPQHKLLKPTNGTEIFIDLMVIESKWSKEWIDWMKVAFLEWKIIVANWMGLYINEGIILFSSLRSSFGFLLSIIGTFDKRTSLVISVCSARLKIWFIWAWLIMCLAEAVVTNSIWVVLLRSSKISWSK